MAHSIQKIVIHCSATQNGVPLAKKRVTAAQRIDDWHKKKGFHRQNNAIKNFNSHLSAIGYHFVIDTDGALETGRQVGEVGAHVKGHNKNSIGICLVGGISITGKNFGRYTKAQWHALSELLQHLQVQYPKANILGHRDFDGVHKDCPCFDVSQWLDSDEIVNINHLFKD
ncbi:N-acetylmuramoyl-L-alanine amidase [Phocoenobacter skyensis]|uniref:N-acetylmuramoyl-L-alanine amidase n=1 Tax=Phocoenobacter skyensis TaxID=97481 RepID=A0ABT9JKR9_9PAST|nr:N-acetylmuramoyl-L-alanine amidase [Pasteurella skyensis]MDP8079532.1 N-acetylmuramoyl-L-alanine amidase [Pasteurella skyensis]MDP8085404.1 N-acetylmuramoyl-L-alanine amidase [Pasteurella skyensis]